MKPGLIEFHSLLLTGNSMLWFSIGIAELIVPERPLLKLELKLAMMIALN